MLPYCNEVVLATIHERRSRLQAEAEAYRLERQMRQHTRQHHRTRLLFGHLLAAAGARLVDWGLRLQTNQPDLHTGPQEIYPA